ncbi:MAG: BACON domain-containing protein, partial [Defluviitaleaceae bacterium]|nr:BACON domain-containing protein [Defluviitaleaceae bacterium]
MVVSVTAHGTWNISSNVSWLTISNITPSTRTGGGFFTINAAANTGTNTRSGTITVTLPGAPTRTVSVTQAAHQANLALSRADWSIGTHLESNAQVNVTSNGQWTVTSNAAWLTISNISPANRTGNGSFRMNASANPGTGGRTASVTVTIPGVVTRSITVTQGAQAASLSLSHGSWNPSFGAESLTVNVFANRAWNVSSNATSWLTVTPASGNGNGSFRINVTANNSAGARSGTITATMTGATSRTVTVTQGAPAANLSLSHSTWNPSFAADSLTVTVTANRAWNVSSNATSWLTVTPASGNGNGSFRINTTANTGTAARSGTITATIPGVVSRTITV